MIKIITCFIYVSHISKSIQELVETAQIHTFPGKLCHQGSRFFSPIFRSQDDNKSRFIKTKSLRDKFRESKTWSLRRSVEKEPSPVSCDKNGNSNHNSHDNSSHHNSSTTSTAVGQLSRLFSLRRSLGPSGSIEPPKASMPCVAEEEEQMAGGPLPTRRCQPPTLPPAPPNLTSAQLKRRHIVSSLVHSENNYVASLQRLVNDYKKPLEESNPPILSSSKVRKFATIENLNQNKCSTLWAEYGRNGSASAALDICLCKRKQRLSFRSPIDRFSLRND